MAKLFSQNNSLEIQKYLGYTMNYMLLLVIPATFGLSLLSKQLLEILSTREISLNAYMVVPLVAISFLFFAAQGVFVQVLYLFKKTSVIGTIWFLGALLNLGSNFIFIPKFGLLGAAFTTLLAYLFVFGATWFFSSKYLSFAIEWKTLLKSVLASLLMSLAILFFRPEGLLETGVSIVLGTLLYALLLFGMKGIGKKEIEFFAKLF
ncbi:MAG: polysaccharide biosynthesis C-terminal domain-containing protein [Candidatus Wildermuthbacteria bacterium]|nr:polysaccharide biosynthesis C-terminal domain-containing protein [Candidatus Wildermuthbacteria bacterium]